jgi:hypothetical protein
LEHPEKSLAPATARLIDDDSPFRQPKRLTREDFALYRGYLDGVELSQLHTRYSPFTDLRRTRTHLVWLRDALSIAARRAQDPAAARLLRLRPGSLSHTDEDKVISTASVHKGATSAHTGPDLEAFRAETDPDGFYSEAELLELYAAAFPIERAHHHDKRRSRRHRLRERQVAALARLEFTLAELPDRSHALNTWFEPALAKRLEAAGLISLADLLALIERYRWRWHVQVPRIGPKTAARISTWLAANSQSLRCEISLLAFMPRRKGAARGASSSIGTGWHEGHQPGSEVRQLPRGNFRSRRHSRMARNSREQSPHEPGVSARGRTGRTMGANREGQGVFQSNRKRCRRISGLVS